MHVDFNCLFEKVCFLRCLRFLSHSFSTFILKGKTFEKPECVPFRLTHNMVDALGPSGVEGVFKKCCEITLRKCRENAEALISVLETFVYDSQCDYKGENRTLKKPRRNPFLDTRNYLRYAHGASSVAEGSAYNELLSQDATSILSLINKKLEGCVTASLSASLPLGANGQIHDLIEQATSTENLSKMYIGESVISCAGGYSA